MHADSRRPVVGLLHPGEMGASFAAALTEQGLPVLWASDGRSEQSRRRAHASGLDDGGTLGDLVRQADIVLSICPPHAAVEVATSVAGAGFAGLYVDANAVAPTTTLEIERVVCGAGGRFVDGDVIGGPLQPGGATRLYLSGREASEVAALLADSDRVEAVVLGDDPTAASALKMCYAAWTKGTAALLLAIRAVARATGVEDPLLSEWDRSQPDLPARTESARRVVAKAWRFAGEMDEIARCFGDVGVANGFPEGAAEIYRILEACKGEEPQWDDILARILEADP